MHRLYVETSVLEAEVPILSKEASRHLKVLRPQKGEQFELFDALGAWRVYEFNGLGLLPISSLSIATRHKREIALFACVTKSSRWDWTIEKATELGVDLIVPVISSRTIVRIPSSERQAKRERWYRIAIEAVGQSGARFAPKMNMPVDFDEALNLLSSYECFTGALTTPSPPSLLTALQNASIKSNLAVFIGPEGDFTPEELDKLLAVSKPVNLGETVLRAETASIYGLSVLSAFRCAHSRENL